MRREISVYSFFQRNRNLINILLLFIIAVVIYKGVFLPGVAARTDLFLPTSDWLKEQSSHPWLWSFEGGGKYIAAYELQLFPLYALWNTLHERLGLPIDLGRRIVWIYVFIVVGIVSMYALGKKLTQSNTAAFVSALYFIASIMNVWAIHGSWVQGAAGMSFVPLCFLFFLKSLEEKERLRAWLCLLTSVLCFTVLVWYELKIAMLAFALLCTFFIFYAARNSHRVMLLVFWFGIFCLGILIANAWIIIPTFLTGFSGIPESASQSAYIVKAESLYSLYFIPKVFLRHGVVFLPLLSILVFFVFLPLLFSSSLYVIYFSFTTLLLMVLSSAGSGPFGFIYSLLYRYVPFFVAFKDTTKFLLFLVFPVSVLLGFSAFFIETKLIKKLPHRITYPGTFTAVIFLFLCIGAIFPALSGANSFSKDKAGSILSPRPIPEDMSFLYDWVKVLPKDYKMLLYPGASPFQITDNRHPGLGALYYTFSPAKELLMYFWLNPYNRISIVKRGLTNRSVEMLKLMNIRNLVFYPEYEYMWGVIPGIGSQKNAVSVFKEQQGLRKLSSSEGLALYEIDAPLPLLYGVSKIDYAVGGRSIFLPLFLLDFDFTQHALLFNSQLKNKFLEIGKNIDSVIFYGKDMDDLAISALQDRYKISLWNHARFSGGVTPTDQRPYNIWNEDDKGWVKYYAPYWLIAEGEIQEGSHPGLVKAGFENADMFLNFDVPKGDAYEVWVRMGVGHDIWGPVGANEISFHLDYLLLGYVAAGMKNCTGLKWLKIGQADLTAGTHSLWIRNRCGINVIDQVAVVPTSALRKHYDKIVSILKTKKIIFLFEAERNFVPDIQSDWTIEFYNGSASQGYALATKERNAAIRLKEKGRGQGASLLKIPHAGRFNVKLRLRSQERMSLTIKIDGKKVHSTVIPVYREFSWFEVPAIFLSEGEHDLAVEKHGKGLFALDCVVVLSEDSKERTGFSKKETGSARNDFSWKEEKITEFRVRPGRDTRLIVFNTNYNPDWSLKGSGGISVQPLPVNSWANGFLLKEKMSGDKELILLFKLQEYIDSIWLYVFRFLRLLAVLTGIIAIIVIYGKLHKK
ncbi:MAG: hypothetical protein AB1530_06535, partial [Candidatus Omnitrophota bacterium]